MIEFNEKLSKLWNLLKNDETWSNSIGVENYCKNNCLTIVWWVLSCTDKCKNTNVQIKLLWILVISDYVNKYVVNMYIWLDVCWFSFICLINLLSLLLLLLLHWEVFVESWKRKIIEGSFVCALRRSIVYTKNRKLTFRPLTVLSACQMSVKVVSLYPLYLLNLSSSWSCITFPSFYVFYHSTLT